MDETERQFEMQRELQRDSLDSQQNLYAPQMMEQAYSSQAVIIQETNLDKIVEEIILKLKGLYKDEDGSIKKYSEPMMNQLGVSRAAFFITVLVNQHTIYSDLENNEITKLMMQVSNDLTDDLTLNWKIYGITDKMQLDYIENAVLIPCYLALKRALKHGERTFTKGITFEAIGGKGQGGRDNSKGDSFWSKVRL